MDPFAQNIIGAQNLVESDMNKTRHGRTGDEEVGELLDVLELPMTDEELLDLKREWTSLDDGYSPKIKPRQDKNKLYYTGKQRANGMAGDSVVTSNLIFEAEETFIPQALSKNPEPVVWSDNTDEGKQASNDIKTMLQFHADTLCLRKKLGVMVRHWSIYFTGVLKHGWDSKLNDITTEIRKPQNFVFDPDGYIDEFGNYNGAFLGEKVPSTAKKMIELFPNKKTELIIKCDGKLGTPMTYTEWWTDEFCFSTFEDIVLDKHKNEFFSYGEGETKDGEGNVTQPAIIGQNHFAIPKMPYTFLSVFSLQEHPHDITNLIEQSVPNQDQITDRDLQISKNLRNGNNSLVLSMLHGWNQELGRQGAQAMEDGDPILGPGEIDDRSIRRLPASPLPSGVLESLQNDKDTLRSVFGTQGLSAQQEPEQTARGMILNQSHDSTRIGGGVGDALEQVADNVFNWWLQLYYVFYDEPHYAATIGNGRAVEYVRLIMSNNDRKFVVSVAPNSMKPKDEIAETNEAIQLWESKALDPISLFKRLNDPDPMETAKKVALWSTNPQLYMLTYFPEQTVPNSPNPQNPNDTVAPAQGPADASLSAEPASSQLSQVPLNNPS